MHKEKWAVVGGGILGMTMALRLAQKGHSVELFEGQLHLGGLTGTSHIGTVSWDSFYHVILMSDLHTRALLRELELEQDLKWVETKSGFYSGGKLYSMSNVLEFLRFPPLGLIGKLRLGGTIFYASRVSNWRKLESIPVEEWLTRLSGRKVFERIWQPLLKAKLGDLYRETSASFIWSTIQRLYAARRSGMKKEMFGYLPGGYRRINLALRKKLEMLGVEIRTGSAVEQVKADHAGLKVLMAGGEFLFDKVVSTLASPLSLQLASLREEERSLHAGIRYLGVICPSVLLNKAISPYYVTNIIDRESLFTGVIEMTALVSPEETGGRHLVYLPRYLESNDKMFSMNDAEIRERFQDALLRMYPQLNSTDILAWNISRAKYVFALPTLHYSDRLPGVHTSIPGYFIVNSAQIINGTLNVNETIQVAEQKLKEIMKP